MGEPSAVAALEGSDAVVLASSIHVGAHQARFVRFVAAHRAALDARPTPLLQIILTARDHDDEAHRQVEAVGPTFEEAAGWRPGRWDVAPPVTGIV